MTQLGAGNGTSWPHAIDTRQNYVNGPTPAPDSASRIDAEVLNDLLSAVVSLQTSLGANPNGTYGSVAARLNAFLPGGGGMPGVFTFTDATTVAIPGTMHNVGQAALLFRLYDANIPANAMAPGSYQVAVNSTTYDVTVSFSTPTSGLIALGATGPLYVAPFTVTSSPFTFSILGSTHLLGTSDLQFQLYDNGTPLRNAMAPGSLTIHQTTHDVLLGFVTAISGLVVLSAGSPTYATANSYLLARSYPATNSLCQRD